MELGRAISEHLLDEPTFESVLQERLRVVAERNPKRHPGQLPLPVSIPSFSVSSYRFRRIGNFSDLLVTGKRADDTEEHVRIWCRGTKRNKHDKPNIVRAAEICLTRVAEDILLNKPMN